MNLPKHIIEARLATIRALIAAKAPFHMAIEQLNIERNNIRDLMRRHNIPLPDGWKPRPTKKYAARVPNGLGFLPDQVADPAALTDEEREAAERFGIRFERAAWLLQCEYSGTAYGLRITRTASFR